MASSATDNQSTGKLMPTKDISAFIADWFARFDRLAPLDTFLPNLHPQVDWDMPHVDRSLSGHNRVRAWYANVVETFQRPTEHHISNLSVSATAASFEVLFRARTFDGQLIVARVQEAWRFDIMPDGSPLITHYSAKML